MSFPEKKSTYLLFKLGVPRVQTLYLFQNVYINFTLVCNRRTMCHRRPRNSDILSKVALLLVLLPHMAQTQYARGKPSFFSFFLPFFG